MTRDGSTTSNGSERQLARIVPRACPFCGEEKSRLLVDLPPLSFCGANETYRENALAILGVSPDSRFPIVECGRCRFVYASPRLSDGLLHDLYDEVIDWTKAERVSRGLAWTGHQLVLAGRALSAIGSDAPADTAIRLLDFGCGYGTLVEALSSIGIDCIGFETSILRVNALRAKQLRVYDDMREIERHAPYRGIIASDVLEHVPFPRETLRLFSRLLSPRGLICVNVPDFSQSRLQALIADARCGRLSNAELNPWEHLNYFSPRSLRDLLVSEGFDPEMDSPVDVGIRAGLHGIRRIGNAVKSFGRLVHFSATGLTRSTTVIARKRGAT
jgi:2-polyprenyl-3-methyl-5-hydroxy-6-metoxy-1,4-benzoquinol methylase